MADPWTREEFDRLDRAWNDGNANSEKLNTVGELGWGASGALASYIVMYRATGDLHYLDKLIAHVDRMLANRDSVRGVKDYRGLSLPAWQSAGHYTCGSLILRSAAGKPLLTVRTASRPASKVTVEVVPSRNRKTFSLICSKGMLADEYHDLTMDPADEKFAPRYVNARFADINADGEHAMITAVDARQAADETDIPAAVGPVAMKAQPYVYAVQTGMILQPIAEFVRIVMESEELRKTAKYRDKAEEFREAAAAALEIFEDEWREDEKTGEGWLVWRKGSPVAFDGSDQPHNQYLALGSAMIHLSAATSSESLARKLRERATKMARTFKNDLKPAKNGGYSWTYFWTKGKAYNGWRANDEVSEYQSTFVHLGRQEGYKAIEDVSHGYIDATFARLAFDNKLGVFDEEDMRRFAATYARNILGGERASETVDGGGKQGQYDNIAAVGLLFARWDGSIVEKVKRLYTTGSPSGSPQSRLLGTAYLNLAVS